MAFLFPGDLCGIPSDAVPRSLAIPGSSSREFRPLYRVLLPLTCPAPEGAELPPLGLPLSIATSVYGVHLSIDFPTYLRSARGVSRALDGLLPLTPCRLISSHCHVRDSLFRGFPRQLSRLTFTNRSPHVVDDSLLRLSCPTRAGSCRLAFRGFPTTGPLPPTDILRLPAPDPLLSFHSRGTSSEHLGTTFATPPLMTFPADSSCDASSRT
jgi:hypothetical protein